MDPISSARPPAADVAASVAVVGRQRLLIATMTLWGLVLALVYSLAIAHPSYVSHAKVLVSPITSAVTPQVDKMVVMGTERELARSAVVAGRALERLGSAEPVSSLQRRAAINVVGATQMLDIGCSAATRDGAQRCAQALAEAYLERKTRDAAAGRDVRRGNGEAALAPINRQIVDVTRRLAALRPETSAQAEAEATMKRLEDEAKPYRQMLADLARINVENPGQVVSQANRPSAPTTPNTRQNVVLGGLVGLVVGLLTAFGRDKADRRLRGRLDLEEYLQAPVLANVPRTRRNGRTTPTLATIDDPNSPGSDAYRALRTRILVTAERQGLRTIMVASPTGEDGRSAIAANLAVSLTQVGKRVVLLSADLRSSTLHQYFGLTNERGLSNVLAGEMPPGAAVQEPAGLERLWVLGSGPVPAQPTELLQGDLMRQLLAEGRTMADFVIIEAPAAFGAADCLALAPLADGILVVADAKRTDRDDLAQLRIQFEQVGGQVVGAVMSNATLSGRA